MEQQCYRHSSRATALSCGRCGRPICWECASSTDVGLRCPVCAKPQRIPTLVVSPLQYTLAGAVALVLGVVAGGIFGVVGRYIGGVPLFGGIVLIVGFLFLGYTVGEGVSRAVNRKRSVGLQVVAGGGVVVMYLVSNVIVYGTPWVLNLFMLMVALITVAVAASRVH